MPNSAYDVAARLQNAKRKLGVYSILAVFARGLSFSSSLLLTIESRPSTMIQFLLRLLFISVAMCSPLHLHLLPTSNASSVASDNSPTLNATRLRPYNETYNDCFDHTTGHIFTTTKSDCERALDTIVKGKSLLEIHNFGYKSRGVTDRLPVEAEYGTCNIALMMFDLDTRISLTYAEIYAEILGPDGLLKECLGPSVPKVDALGGQTVLGPQNMLIVDVTGRPRGPTDGE